MINSKRYRMRIIVPSFPNFNIYSFAAKETTSSGPICVATSVSKLQSWDVEVIDENNCRNRYCPKDSNGLPDHEKLQKERPADVVGFYGSITTTIPRLYQIAKIYKKMGAKTVAGGKHVENLPEEALANDVDFVVFGEGENTIKDLLLALQNHEDLKKVDGIGFFENNVMYKTNDRKLIDDFESLPFPNFNLLLYAKIKYYPINRTRGCNMNCEFCAVKDKTRSCNPAYMLGQIAHLVETKKADHFFEASDHFASNVEEAMEFCKLLTDYQKKIGKKLCITVQTRITDARHPELLEAMRDANIDMVCIGYESPIDEELKAMKKGYLSKDLLDLTNVFHKYGFFIHGMFIFGYPQKPDHRYTMLFEEKIKRFKEFIKKGKLDTLQVLLTIPLPGTELHRRLQAEGRLYPLDKIGWEYYDGQFPLFEPDDNISPEDMQKAVIKIMARFYHFYNFWKLVRNILFHFPRIMFISTTTLITFKVRYIINAFLKWKDKYYRNYILRFGGYFIIKWWFKNFKNGEFLDKLNKAKLELLNKKVIYNSPTKR